jgi:hypothetical protein
VKAFSPARPQYALTVLASSDLNGVSSFNEGKVGSNFGALVSVGIKKMDHHLGRSVFYKTLYDGV